MIHNRFKCILLTVIALLLTFACEKENSETFADLIIGKWEWVETVDRWTGKVINPQTVGYSQTLEFSKEGSMKRYLNDSLLLTTDYCIERFQNNPDLYELRYSSGLRENIYFIEDTMFMYRVYAEPTSAYADATVTSYVRLK